MIHLTNMADIYRPRYVWIWLLSAFKAGFINSAGFLVTGSFVSHVTGFGTQVGMALGNNDYFFGAEILIIPIAFIFGGVVTSFVLDRNKSSTTPPPYHIVQGLITVVIALVLIIGEARFGNITSNPPHPAHYGIFEFSIISLLCFVCGLKNSLIAWTTKGKVRVTHLTGLSTDIGLNFLKMIPGKNNPYYVSEEKISNLVRMLTFVSFSVGACSSAIIFPQLGYKGFFIVMTISLVLTFVAFRDRKRIIEERQAPTTRTPSRIYDPLHIPSGLTMAASNGPTNERQASGMANR